MRQQLVDTTPLAALLTNRPPLVSLLSPALSRDALATSIVVYGEVLERIKGAPDYARRRAGLRQLLRGVRPYLITYPIVERYADIRRQLRPPHGLGLIGDIDTLIAATALTYNLELITTDSDFARVPGLAVRLLERSTFEPVQR